MPEHIEVALVCGEGESARLLREVVRGIGRPIVHEALATAFDPAALASSGANVVIVDLPPDAEIDAVYDLLDDDRYRVIFNDSEVTSRLSGWEHARWARHLAAKILDVPAVVDPPRPDDVMMQAAGDGAGETFVPPPPREPSAAAIATLDAQRGEELGIDDWLSRVMAVEDPAHRFAHEDPTAAEPFLVDLDGGSPARRSSDFAELTAEAPADGIDALMLSAVATMDSGGGAEAPAESAAASGSEDWNIDELIANIDQWLPPAPPVERAPATNASGQEPDASRLWTLVEDDDAVGAPAQPSTKSMPASAATAAADARWAPPSALGSSLLELAPLEDATLQAPQNNTLTPLFAARPPTTAAEMRVEVVSDPGTVTRAIVLCASIGGPEAIRQMLGALPANYPGLFLVVQHVGEEFMDMLTQQLRRSTALRVRTAETGDQLRDGDVVPVPPRQRLVIERNGRVALHARADARVGGPSMDQVLRDVSDRFGPACAAVVLSGVAADAAEGCLYLAGRGGHVYVQSPASCVASSMVEQVQQTGVVSFIGTPPELAAHLLADRI